MDRLGKQDLAHSLRALSAMSTPATLGTDLSDEVVARDPEMLKVLQTAQSLARFPAAVLITGETGSGKEVVARAIHRFSARSARPWIDVNCAALPEHLVESELFGHERGAFSGADTAKPGLFELAHGGTLFLDEIGEIDPRVQVKLLRILDSAPFYRLGGTRKVSVDVRVIAATNRNLEAAVDCGVFRRDLYHRITEFHISVPPLRERPLDIAALATHFLAQLAPQRTFSSDALELLSQAPWPGNVRELRNIVGKLSFHTVGETITAADVRHLNTIGVRSGVRPLLPTLDAAVTLTEVERQMIIHALEATGGNQSRAAQRLGIPRRTFCRKLDEFQITLGRRRILEADPKGARTARRLELQVALQVTTRDGRGLAAATTDVSCGGLGIQSLARPLPVGEHVHLQFSLPDQSGRIQATAVVAWSRPDGSAGVQFTRLRTTQRDALRRWLAAADCPPLPPSQEESHQLTA